MHAFIGPELEMEQTASVEQREAPRVALMLRNAKLSIDGLEILCIVRDISATGVRIKAFHPIPSGKACSIELWEGQRFPVEEAWNGGGDAGYSFCEAKDLDALVYEHGPFPKRAMRINLCLPAAILNGEVGRQGTIRNISQQGACIESNGVWAPSQLVRVKGQGLPDPLHAKIMWHRENLHGLIFERTFALADFARMVARLQRIPAAGPISA